VEVRVSQHLSHKTENSRHIGALGVFRQFDYDRALFGFQTGKEFTKSSYDFVSVMRWQSAVWGSGHPSMMNLSLEPEPRISICTSGMRWSGIVTPC
jgi:hypothetical protein